MKQDLTIANGRRLSCYTRGADEQNIEVGEDLIASHETSREVDMTLRDGGKGKESGPYDKALLGLRTRDGPVPETK